jgi:CheY-like chemotaxis protein
MPEADPSRESLQAVEKLSWRAAELVRQLLGFSRRSVLRRRPVNLRDEAEALLHILRRVTDPRIQVDGRFAADLWPVLGDAAQIGQVIMNLCLNARDAMPEGGRLFVQGDNVQLDAAAVRLRPGGRAGTFVRLRVTDTGHGMPPEVLAHLFEPFFTTKPPGKGTGLGLAMVFDIVEQHQGWIECESNVGVGTRFDVYLPVHVGEPAVTPATPAPPAATGRGTILFADDEPAIRTLAREWLEAGGYTVLLAQDGQEALDAYRARQGSIDLVILDLIMPRLSGRDAIAALKELDPHVRLLGTSGASVEQRAEFGAHEFAAFLAKPYTREDLLAAVQAALQTKPGPGP